MVSVGIIVNPLWTIFAMFELSLVLWGIVHCDQRDPQGANFIRMGRAWTLPIFSGVGPSPTNINSLRTINLRMVFVRSYGLETIPEKVIREWRVTRFNTSTVLQAPTMIWCRNIYFFKKKKPLLPLCTILRLFLSLYEMLIIKVIFQPSQ